MLSRGDLKNTVFLVGAEGFSRGLALFLTILIAKELGVVEFGSYSTAVSYVFLFSVFIEIGLSTFTFREISKDKSLASQYISNAIVIQLFLAIVIGLIVFVSAKLIGYPTDTRLTIYLLWFWMIGISLGRMIRVVFKANQRMEIEAIINIFENSIRFVIVLLVIRMGFGVIGVAVGSIISALCMFMLSVLVAKLGGFYRSNHNWEWNTKFLIDLAKYALPFALSIISAVIMYRLSIVLLSIIKDNYAVGIFDASFKILAALFFIPGLVCQAFFPKMSQFGNTNLLEFSKIIVFLIRYLFVFLYPLFILLFIFSPQIINILYTDEFLPTIPVFRILVWVNIFNIGMYIGMYSLNAARHEKKLMLIMFLGMSLKFVISIVLIILFSYIGAAVAALLSEVVLVIILIVYFRHKGILSNEMKLLILKLVGVIACTFIVVLIGLALQLPEIIIGIGFAGAFLIAVGLFRVISRNELANIKTLIFHSTKPDEYLQPQK